MDFKSWWNKNQNSIKSHYKSLFEEKTNKQEETKGKKSVKRKFGKITSTELENKITSILDGRNINNLLKQIGNDLKIEFDFENWDYDPGAYDDYNGLMGSKSILINNKEFNFIGFAAGGDWEFPVYFIVYHDGKKLRAYVPTNGNCFNPRTKRAWGNSYYDEFDLNNNKEETKEECEEDEAMGTGDAEADVVAILNDIKDRFE